MKKLDLDHCKIQEYEIEHQWIDFEPIIYTRKFRQLYGQEKKRKFT
jgi:hypothetical protein